MCVLLCIVKDDQINWKVPLRPSCSLGTLFGRFGPQFRSLVKFWYPSKSKTTNFLRKAFTVWTGECDFPRVSI